MSDSYIGEVKLFANSYVPRGWIECRGQQLPISQYTMLYSVIGSRYGGDDRTYFCVPNLTGRVLIGAGTGPGLSPRQLGESGGAESVVLSVNNLPPHNHSVLLSNANGSEQSPANNVPAKMGQTGRGGSFNPVKTYQAINSHNGFMADQTVGQSGNGHSHPNQQPFLTMVYAINFDGIYPPRS